MDLEIQKKDTGIKNLQIEAKKARGATKLK